MTRLYNFSPGPAALPQAVLERARAELTDYAGRGISVMEMSHRSKEFLAIAAQAETDLRDLLEVPDDYAVLFLHGGATAQFSAVPLNLTAVPSDVAAFINTGRWSQRAMAEARRYCGVVVAATGEDRDFTQVPAMDEWELPAHASYVHICPNETIDGVEFPFVPDVGGTPLVADFSSAILSRPIDVAGYGVIYAGAQKNIGPAGLSVVIVRRDLLGRARVETPALLNWQVCAESDSMYNTPPTFAWYLSGLVFQWLKELGGLQAMAQINQRKAATLYEAIDGSAFYTSQVAQECRSRMNVPFRLAAPELDSKFLEQAEGAGLLHLKGHRSVGGMRASLYNAVGQDAVDALVAFMADFEARYG